MIPAQLLWLQDYEPARPPVHRSPAEVAEYWERLLAESSAMDWINPVEDESAVRP